MKRAAGQLERDIICLQHTKQFQYVNPFPFTVSMQKLPFNPACFTLESRQFTLKSA
jgi:hypothetical protein